MDHAAYLAALRTSVGRLAELTAGADLDDRVPTCPDWDVASLVGHVVDVHTWVCRLLGGAEGFGSFPGDVVRPPRSPAAFATWYREAGEAMLGELAARDPGDPCWTFSATDRTVGFWPRRQLHEINVHAFDTAVACGSEFAVGPAEAADGIDELLVMFGPRMARRGVTPSLAAPITIAPTDVAASWTVRPPGEAGDAETTDDATGSVATLSGPASDVFFALWNRLPHDRIAVSGDRDVGSAYLASQRVP